MVAHFSESKSAVCAAYFPFVGFTEFKTGKIGLPRLMCLGIFIAFIERLFQRGFRPKNLRVTLFRTNRCRPSLWRTVKYEDIYLKEYASVGALEQGLERYFTFYNQERPHQSLNYATPAHMYAQESASS